jgi:hypothetical protein
MTHQDGDTTMAQDDPTMAQDDTYEVPTSDLDRIAREAMARSKRAYWAKRKNNEWDENAQMKEYSRSQYAGLVHKAMMDLDDSIEAPSEASEQWAGTEVPTWAKNMAKAQLALPKHRTFFTLQRALLNRKYRNPTYRLPKDHPMRAEEGLTLDAFRALRALYNSFPAKHRAVLVYIKRYLDEHEPVFRQHLEDWKNGVAHNGS